MNGRKGWVIGTSFMLALLFALVFYAFTTPLGPSIGSDNAMYMTIGTALANGYAPYTEIFDHKGPLLFVLQWIPQAIGGGYSMAALFIQQVVYLFACLLVIAMIAGQFSVSAMPVQLSYLALICGLVGGGNLTEEYSNLFTLLGIALMVTTFKNDGRTDKKNIGLRAAALGALASVCFLIRANNALVLCAMTLGIALMLCIRKEYGALCRCAGGFLAGMILAALPVVIWLAAHGALEESVYGAILHNMMYSETGGQSRLEALLNTPYGHKALLMACISLCGALVMVRRNRMYSMMMASGALAGILSAFISRKCYDHYLILGVPAAVMGVCAVLCVAAKKKEKLRIGIYAAVMILSLSVIFVEGRETNRWRLSETQGLDEFTANAQALYAQVPQEDRDEFMAYRVEPKWYVAAQALPCMRFFFLQEILAQADPAVMDEIVEEFETRPPKWLVIYYNRPFSPPYDERVAEIFASCYEFVDAKGQYQLLRYKGDGSKN